MRIFSGIQPTGRKHLGNFIGAIRGYVEGQGRGEAIYCIVDLHALTASPEPDVLRTSVYDTAAILLAAGLDPDRCILFRQSDVREHTELCWLLSPVTGFGELRRMHQFKEKAARSEFISAGLAFYPILQAADILAYRTDEVPVGEDQKQHIELTREIAQRFNARFGETFVVPTHRIPPVGARIMDLQAPDRKMSTTGGSPLGTVYVLDEPAEIERKFRSAVTDSGREILYRPEEKPGVTNLIEVLAAVRGEDPAAVEAEFAGGGGYGAFKRAVGEAVAGFLAPVRERYEEIRPDQAGLEDTLAEGARRARAVASETVAIARDRMGIGPKLG